MEARGCVDTSGKKNSATVLYFKVGETNCSNSMTNCSKRKVGEANCSINMVNCSKRKVGEDKCSINMVNCSKRKVGKCQLQ